MFGVGVSWKLPMNNEKMLQTRVRFPEHAVFSSNFMAQLLSWEVHFLARVDLGPSRWYTKRT